MDVWETRENPETIKERSIDKKKTEEGDYLLKHSGYCNFDGGKEMPTIMKETVYIKQVL